jgi:hypothetical protein
MKKVQEMNEEFVSPYVEIKNESVVRAKEVIKMVAKEFLNGCSLVGPAGMGKTKLVTEILKQEGVKCYVVTGHLTLAETYELLYEKNGELIFLDDVSQVINEREIMELLKGALNTGGTARVLHYRSKGVLRDGTPNNFNFTGRIIMAFNEVDKNNMNVKAVLSRAPLVELKYSRADVLAAMYQIATGDGGGLFEYEKMLVTKELEDHADMTMELNLRTQQNGFNTYRYFKQTYGEGNTMWKDAVVSMLGKKKRSYVADMIIEMVGLQGKINRLELAKQLALAKEMSLRTAQRRITEGIEMGELGETKLKGGDVFIK